ncbi:MAG: tetratricopeptide repeat protein [Planctomycetes bacterium]|nr:tetratricopeptide repeat protein [Planctomycetota bacterium]
MSATVERFEALLTVRRYADAEECARDLIAQYPDWGPSYTHLARVLVERERYDDALVAAKEGVRKAPHDSWAHAIVSLVYERMQKYEKSIEAAKESLRLFPTYGYAFCLLTFSYDKLGKFAEALQATTEGLMHQPHDQELLRFHALNLYRVNRLKEAEATARECLRLHPTSHESLQVLGLIAMMRAEKATFRRIRFHRQGHEFFLQALRLRPTLEHLHDNARDNAVSCRRYVWMLFLWTPYLVFVGIATYLAMVCMTGKWSFTESADQIKGLLFIPGVTLVACLAWGEKQSAAFFLSLPLLDLWGLPTIPPREAQARLRWWSDWRVMVAVPPVLGIVLATAVLVLAK